MVIFWWNFIYFFFWTRISFTWTWYEGLYICNLCFFCVNYLEVVAYLTDILLQKVSQFMSRAVRLNEAFSVVRRVPIIRPSLPASGANPWPVMSLR